MLVIGSCVLFICLAWILFGGSSLLPAHVLGLIIGLASGASMLTFAVMKEANPPEWTGTATGVMSFLNISFGAFIVPVVAEVIRVISRFVPIPLDYERVPLGMLLCGVVLAIVLTGGLKETGRAVRGQQRERETA